MNVLNTPNHEFYKPYIEAVSKNKNIVDIACGDGFAGKIALEHGATSVIFADARLESLVHPIGYTNYQQTFIDLNFPQTLKTLLSGADTVFYFGHLYHCNNHEEILDAIINSDCKDFLISTKVGLADLNIDLDTPTITELNPEAVNDRLNGWHNSTESHIQVGHPNLSWMIDYFNRNKSKVTLQKSVKSIDNFFTNPDNGDTFHHRIYMFHVVKRL